MTLIAGFRCTDGFVIAADTAMTLGNVTYQGHKVMRSAGLVPYTFYMGFAGDEGHALAASQGIRDALRSLRPATFADVKQVIADTLTAFYEKHVFRDWKSIGETVPSFDLVIGLQAQDKNYGVLRTTQNVVHEVEESVFIGSGTELASYVCEQLFSGERVPTAIAHHLALQLFRAVKGSATYVGGNTHVFSRRCESWGPAFFETPSLDKELRASWALDDMLFSAIRIALGTEDNSGQPKTWPLLGKRLSQIRDALTLLYADSHDEGNQLSSDEIFTFETPTGVGNPFKDSR